MADPVLADEDFGRLRVGSCMPVVDCERVQFSVAIEFSSRWL